MSTETGANGGFVIERGTIDFAEWQRLSQLAVVMGGKLVENVAQTETEVPFETDAPVFYVGRDQFMDFAERQRVDATHSVRAYRGFLRIAFEQMEPGPLAALPGLIIDPPPSSKTFFTQLLSRTNSYRVDVMSLREFLTALDVTLQQSRSNADKTRIYKHVLPDTVGQGTIELYKKFVVDQLDKDDE